MNCWGDAEKKIVWNVAVGEIKSKYMNEIREKIENKWVDEKSKQYVIDDVQFNVLTLFMLDYYSEYYQSDFYERMLAIYLSGHLPCGWSGEYPEGRFIVYEINKNLKAFIDCIFIYKQYEPEINNSSDDDIELVLNEMRLKFEIIDKEVFNNEENWWSIILEQIEFGMM